MNKHEPKPRRKPGSPTYKCVYCERDARTRGLCETHYGRFNKGSKIALDAPIKDTYGTMKDYTSADRHRYRRYGLTTSQYYALGNCCHICDYRGRQLVVDHCHETNKVRGLLCRMCNTGIGGLQDNVEIMAKAIGYINANKKT